METFPSEKEKEQNQENAKIDISLFNEYGPSDVLLIVGEGAQQLKIPAHKDMLSIDSRLFDVVFQNGLLKTPCEIQLKDINPEAFVAVLKYMYTEEVQINSETAMSTLLTAQTFMVSELKDKCINFLKSNMNLIFPTEVKRQLFTFSATRYFDPTQGFILVENESPLCLPEGNRSHPIPSEKPKFPKNQPTIIYLTPASSTQNAAEKNSVVSNFCKIPVNWQASHHTMKDRITFLFNKETLSDVHFVVGMGAKQKRIHAHKIILSMGSPVFNIMCKQAVGTNSKDIELPDVDPSSFLSILWFLYSNEIPYRSEDAILTCYTAKNFMIPALEKLCEDFIQHTLSTKRAEDFIRWISQTKAIKSVEKYLSEALAAEGFTSIDHMKQSCIPELLPSNSKSHLVPSEMQDLPIEIPGNQQNQENANGLCSIDTSSLDSSSQNVAENNAVSCSSKIPFNWQTSQFTVRDRLAFMFNQEIMNDVTFIVGEGAQKKRILANRSILSMSSIVFELMFNVICANKNEFVQPDDDPQAFQALLRFIYTDEVKITPETALPTLYLAQNFLVPSLEKECKMFISKTSDRFMLEQKGMLVLKTIANYSLRENFDINVVTRFCIPGVETNVVELPQKKRKDAEVDHEEPPQKIKKGNI